MYLILLRRVLFPADLRRNSFFSILHLQCLSVSMALGLHIPRFGQVYPGLTELHKKTCLQHEFTSGSDMTES